MKIVVNQKNLQRALGLVERVIARNVSLPMLSMILLRTENGRLRISGTNLEVGINAALGAKVDEVGEIAVPGRIFSDFVHTLTEENITLTTKSNNLLIHSKSFKTNILCADAKEYPIIPKITKGVACTVSALLLKDMFFTVADSVAASEARPELAGVFMQFEDQRILCAATDSFRLTERKVPMRCVQDQSVIIPRSTMAEMIRIASEVQGDFAVKIGDNQISFASDDVEVVSRLIDGKYPDYTKVIPEHFVSKALATKSELEKAIRLAGLFSSNIADIKLHCEENSIHISASNSDKGDMEATVEALLKGEPFEISLNFHYLLDGLKVMPTDKIVVEFTGKGSPLMIKPAEDKKETLYLIMPLRS